MKKKIIIIILLISFLGYGQRTRDIIDSIHSERLCISYPGLSYTPTCIDEYENSEYIFTGKVIEIIRKETLKPTDVDKNGPKDFEQIQNYWYLFEVSEMFKGNKKRQIKIFARIYSSMSPLLILNKEYLIYAKKVSKRLKKILRQSDPFIFCGDRSCHIKYAERDIIELKKMK